MQNNLEKFGSHCDLIQSIKLKRLDTEKMVINFFLALCEKHDVAKKRLTPYFAEKAPLYLLYTQATFLIDVCRNRADSNGFEENNGFKAWNVINKPFNIIKRVKKM